MDRTSLVGVGLIGLVFIGWLWWIRPSEEELAKQKQIQDSLALVETKNQEELKKIIEEKKAETTVSEKKDSTALELIPDSLKNIKELENLKNTYKNFHVSAKGKKEFYTIENNLIKVKISSKGGKIACVELKNYFRPDKKNVELFNPDSTRQALIFNAYSNLSISTANLFFEPDQKNIIVEKGQTKTIKLKLKTDLPDCYIEYTYSLKDNEYLLSHGINFNKMGNIIGNTNPEVTLDWSMALPSQESHIIKEKQTATIYFRTKVDQDVDYINPNSDEEKSIS